MSKHVERLIKPIVRKMQPYHVADASGMLKLDAMENPFVWNAELNQQWLDYVRQAQINRYPDPSANQLSAELARVMNIPADLQIMLGNGSDEIIQILAMAMALPNASIFAVEPSFVMYKVVADTVGMAYHSINLQADFSLPVDAILAEIKRVQPSLLFFAVPNNPTGNNFSKEDLTLIINAAEGLVVIDEAYMAFTDSNLLAFASNYDNVVIMRTLSKVGLAGLRLGMLIGKSTWVSEFNKIRLPYNINVLTQMTAFFALQHYDVLLQQTAEIKYQRTLLSANLKACAGVTVFESEANFILVRTQHNAREIFEKLKSQGVLIKCLSGGHPLLDNCLRITVSTAEENQQFLAAFKNALLLS